MLSFSKFIVWKGKSCLGYFTNIQPRLLGLEPWKNLAPIGWILVYYVIYLICNKSPLVESHVRVVLGGPKISSKDQYSTSFTSWDSCMLCSVCNFFMSNSINYEGTSSCCKPSGEQDSNLLVTCGYLGVLLLCMHFNMILCLSEWFLAKMSNGVIIT